MASEVREAAERLKDLPFWDGAQNSILVDGFDYSWLLRIRDAYLAEHPADDGEAITEAILLKMGFECSWRTDATKKFRKVIEKGDDFGEMELMITPYGILFEWWIVDGHGRMNVTTRGQLRNLLAALQGEKK
jgi:hypothetical protein